MSAGFGPAPGITQSDLDAALATVVGWPSTGVQANVDTTADAGDLINATASPITVTLPTAPGAAALVAVIHSDTGNSPDSVTVVPHGSGLINGAASFVLSTVRQAAVFCCIGGDTWKVLAVNGVGKADLGSDGKVLDAQLPTAQSGSGLPDGGTTGQALVKASNDDGDAEWSTISGGGDPVPDADDSTKGLIQLTGDLTGTAESPQIAAGAVGATEIASGLKGGAAAGTEALRALGTTSTTAAAGNDSRLSDSRTPTGAAGGVLAGTYPNPTFAADMATQAELDAVAAAKADAAATAAALAGKQPLLTFQDEGTPVTQRATVNATGAGVQVADIGGKTTLTIPGTLGTIVTDTPEAHGAVRDGVVLGAVTTTSSSPNVSCTAAAWVGGDVGKLVMLTSATGTVFKSTILTVTDGTHIVLAGNCTFSASATAVMAYGTDDTAAINSAVSAVVSAAQANGANAGDVIFSTGIYIVNASRTIGSPTNGNAQIPLPVIANTSQKFTLTFRSPSMGGSQLPLWAQTVPAATGAVLLSMATGGTYDGTNGAPSVIGGPSQEKGYGFGSTWSNLLFCTSGGLTIMQPSNPTLNGLDLSGVAQCNIDKLAVLTCEVPGNVPLQSSGAWAGTSAQFATGLLTPLSGNNDNCEVGAYSAHGLYCGHAIGEHVHVLSQRTIKCRVGMRPWGAFPHASFVDYWSSEGCRTHYYGLLRFTSSSGIATLKIGEWDIEDYTGTFVTVSHWTEDSTARTRGSVDFVRVDVSSTLGQLVFSGAATKVRFRNLLGPLTYVGSGVVAQALPGVPQSGGGSVNISAVTQGNPTTITCSGAHGLTTGQSVVIAGATPNATGTTGINGTWNVTVTSSTAFTIPFNSTSQNYSSGGTVVNAARLDVDAQYVIDAAGATITAVSIDGTATGLVPAAAGPPQAITVPATKQLSLTYSGGTPTWTVVPL